MAIVKVERLKKVFGGGELAVTALEDIDFSVEAG